MCAQNRKKTFNDDILTEIGIEDDITNMNLIVIIISTSDISCYCAD